MSNLYDVFDITKPINIEPLDNTKCFHCNKIYPHKKGYKYNEYGLIEVELIIMCCKCRSLFKKKERLNAEILDIDWKLFLLKH